MKIMTMITFDENNEFIFWKVFKNIVLNKLIYKDIKPSKFKLNKYGYWEITSLEWMLKNGHTGLLYEKVMKYDYIYFGNVEQELLFNNFKELNCQYNYEFYFKLFNGYSSEFNQSDNNYSNEIESLIISNNPVVLSVLIYEFNIYDGNGNGNGNDGSSIIDFNSIFLKSFEIGSFEICDYLLNENLVSTKESKFKEFKIKLFKISIENNQKDTLKLINSRIEYLLNSNLMVDKDYQVLEKLNNFNHFKTMFQCLIYEKSFNDIVNSCITMNYLLGDINSNEYIDWFKNSIDFKCVIGMNQSIKTSILNEQFQILSISKLVEIENRYKNQSNWSIKDFNHNDKEIELLYSMIILFSWISTSNPKELLFNYCFFKIKFHQEYFNGNGIKRFEPINFGDHYRNDSNNFWFGNDLFEFCKNDFEKQKQFLALAISDFKNGLLNPKYKFNGLNLIKNCCSKVLENDENEDHYLELVKMVYTLNYNDRSIYAIQNCKSRKLFDFIYQREQNKQLIISTILKSSMGEYYRQEYNQDYKLQIESIISHGSLEDLDNDSFELKYWYEFPHFANYEIWSMVYYHSLPIQVFKNYYINNRPTVPSKLINFKNESFDLILEKLNFILVVETLNFIDIIDLIKSQQQQQLATNQENVQVISIKNCSGIEVEPLLLCLYLMDHTTDPDDDDITSFMKELSKIENLELLKFGSLLADEIGKRGDINSTMTIFNSYQSTLSSLNNQTSDSIDLFLIQIFSSCYYFGQTYLFTFFDENYIFDLLCQYHNEETNNLNYLINYFK